LFLLIDGDFAANPQRAHAEILKNGGQPAEMIMMRGGERHDVNLLEAA